MTLPNGETVSTSGWERRSEQIVQDENLYIREIYAVYGKRPIGLQTCEVRREDAEHKLKVPWVSKIMYTLINSEMERECCGIGIQYGIPSSTKLQKGFSKDLMSRMAIVVFRFLYYLKQRLSTHSDKTAISST